MMASSQSSGISHTAFEEALQRARQLAAKINQQAGGKRPAEEEAPLAPEPKRFTPAIDPIGAQLAAMKHQINAGGITKPSKSARYLNGIIIQGEKTLDIMIPGNKVGYVIGKGGEMIRNLQERAGVKMTVFQESNEATEHEKQLRIIGEPDKVDYARQMVNDLLTEKEIETARLKTKSVTNEYGTSRSGAVEIPVPPQFIGLVIGKGGESIRRIQQETGTKVQFDTQKSDPNGNKVCQILGPADATNHAVEMIKEIIENATGRVSKPKEGDEIRMAIPAHRTGAVIGRGGETIRTIKQQSGCDIELEKASRGGNSDEKYFIIRGPPEKISYAQQLILEKVNGATGQQQPNNTPNPTGMSYNELQQWTNYWKGDSSQANEESKNQDSNAAAWAAYYANYYAQSQQPAPQGASNGSAAAPPDHSSAPPQGDPQQQGGQDYSAQWAEYYRAYGMFKEAEMIEQMAKNPKQPHEDGKSSDHSDNKSSSSANVAYPGYNYSNYSGSSHQNQ